VLRDRPCPPGRSCGSPLRPASPSPDGVRCGRAGDSSRPSRPCSPGGSLAGTRLQVKHIRISGQTSVCLQPPVRLPMPQRLEQGRCAGGALRMPTSSVSAVGHPRSQAQWRLHDQTGCPATPNERPSQRVAKRHACRMRRHSPSARPAHGPLPTPWARRSILPSELSPPGQADTASGAGAGPQH